MERSEATIDEPSGDCEELSSCVSSKSSRYASIGNFFFFASLSEKVGNEASIYNEGVSPSISECD